MFKFASQVISLYFTVVKTEKQTSLKTTLSRLFYFHFLKYKEVFFGDNFSGFPFPETLVKLLLRKYKKFFPGFLSLKYKKVHFLKIRNFVI